MSFVNAIGNRDVNAVDMFAADRENQPKETVKEMFSQLVKEKKAECITKIQSGSSEQSFQIGAGSYTETEWKKLLAGFDAAQAKLRVVAEGANKEVQKINGTAASDKGQEAEEERADNLCYSHDDAASCMTVSEEMLLAEYTTAVYPSSDKELPDDVYYTFYTTEGISCRKQGQSEYEWQIPFEDASQYEKVMSFLQSLDSQNNLRFACHENFWQDFLNDQIEMDKFSDFLETRVVDGVPNYLNVYETGVTIDTEAARYSKYMNLPDFVNNMCYTSEEAFQTFFNHRKVDENKQPGHEVVNRNHLDEYYAKHPDEIGKRNHYYNGRWYSMAELTAVWNKELTELFGQG